MSSVIYFIRHGETDWNAEGRLQGQLDVPLNDLGRVQAEEAGRKLGLACAQVEDLPFISSPLRRARETMEIVRRTLGLHPPYYRLEDRLKEIGFGRWEGLTWKEVRKHHPGGAAERDKDRWRFAPPGGESYEGVLGRLKPFAESLAGSSVVVAHGGVARALMVLMGAMQPETALRQDIHQGRLLALEPGGMEWI